jgi:hypothetical protein
MWQFKPRPSLDLSRLSPALKPASRPLFLRRDQSFCISLSGIPSGERLGGGGGKAGGGGGHMGGGGGGGDVGQALAVLAFGVLAVLAYITLHVRRNLVCSASLVLAVPPSPLTFRRASRSVPMFAVCLFATVCVCTVCVFVPFHLCFSATSLLAHSLTIM